LREKLDFDELYRLSVSGVWGSADEDKLIKKCEYLDDTPAEELMRIWQDNSEGTKAEMNQQVAERIFGLLSLMAIDATEDIFQELWGEVNFDELYRLNGRLGVFGSWGRFPDEGDMF
ncbi:hypothetical protein ACFLXO_08235, partial [Chloroflexota bacterium]